MPPGLVRLSVGLEDVEPLWADLAQALERPERNLEPGKEPEEGLEPSAAGLQIRCSAS